MNTPPPNNGQEGRPFSLHFCEMAAARRRAGRFSAEQALQMLLESDSDISENEDASEDDIRNIESIRRDELDSTDETTSSDDDEENERGNEMLRDKNGVLWSFDPPNPVGRRRAADIFREQGGVPAAHAVKDSVLETFELFFTNEMLEKVVQYSQLKADNLNFNVRLTIESLKAYIAICYYRGANHDQKVPITDLWSEDANPFYKTVMSRTLFHTWNTCISFDDFRNRDERKTTDKFAAMREFYEEWNDGLRQHYIPTEGLTIDEQLIASRCRSPNRVYNPSKPGKYGELVRWCTDAKNRYFLNSSVLTKKPADGNAARIHQESNKAKNLVLNLARPFLNSGRNITADRFFSSVDVAISLYEKRTTYVGTLTKNKRDIPPALHVKQENFESKFVFGGPRKILTLQSQQVKKKKVYLISSLHHDSKIHEDEKQKSEIQIFYNHAKVGVDVLDEMCKRFSTRFKVYRWPLVHFQNQLDVTGCNTYLIYCISHDDELTRVPIRQRRRHFLMELAKQLAMAYMSYRVQNPIGLDDDTLKRLRILTGHENARFPAEEVQRQSNLPQKRCQLCKESGKKTRSANLTSKNCDNCQKNVCGKHGEFTHFLCHQCL